MAKELTVLERQHALGEVWAAFIVGALASQYGLKLYGAIQRNPDHPDTQTLMAAAEDDTATRGQERTAADVCAAFC